MSTFHNDSKFKKRRGTTDKGKDYENLIVANFALKLISNDNIKNFTISSNDADFGDFDDVVLDIEFNDNSVEKYALQLKHVNTQKPVILQHLTAQSGDLALKKYFKSFQEIEKLACGHKLILYTNRIFDSAEEILIEYVDEECFDLKIIKCEAISLLNTSNRSNCCYKFDVVEKDIPVSRKYKIFFENFFMYTNQSNVEQVKKAANKIFQEKFACDKKDSNTYFNVISEWSGCEGEKDKLNKVFVQRVIALQLMSSSIKPLSFGPVSEKMKLLRKIITSFGVTVCGESAYEYVQPIWGDVRNELSDSKVIRRLIQNYQITDRAISDLTDKDWSILLWLIDKAPLILIENKSTYKAIELCQSGKFVILGKGPSKGELKNRSIFRTLLDVDAREEAYKYILAKFMWSIQEKKETSIGQLLEQNEKLRETVTTNELLEMANRTYYIYDKKQTNPEPYITKFLSLNIIDFKYLETIDSSTLIVISNVSEEEKINNHLKNFNLIPIDKYLKTKKFEHFSGIVEYADNEILKNFDYKERKNIYISETECSQENVCKLCEQNESIKIWHHFRITSEKKLQWIQSNKITDLDHYRINDYFVEERAFYKVESNNNVNIINGKPGIGKSVLLNNLRNNISLKYCTVLLTSKEISSFCDQAQNIASTDTFTKYILESKYKKYKTFDKNCLLHLIEKGEVVYLWDGLDEIGGNNLKTITTLIHKLSQNSLMQWIACRPHLTENLEREFNVLSRTISHINDEQQTFYMKNRLTSLGLNETLSEIIDMIKTKIMFPESNDILGIPIQIFMFTELFLNNPKKYQDLLKGIFSLADLYHYFIQEKFNIYYKDKANMSVDNKNAEDILEENKINRLNDYEKAALTALFDSEFLKQENINCDKFLDKIKAKNDPCGFITEISENGQPNFVHISYAEYFAAVYFSKYYRRISTFKNIIFKEKYTNIRFFFDLILAKNSPIHVAVLYKNLHALKNHIDKIKCKDLGGRNVLHLACSWGERFPILNVIRNNGNYVINCENDQLGKPENLEYRNILEYLLDKIDVNETDDLFKINALLYAERCNCLFAIAYIEVKQRTGFLEQKDESFICSILYYSVKFGYAEFVGLVGDKKYVVKKEDLTMLHVAVEESRNNCLEKLLLEDLNRNELNSQDLLGRTPIFLACDQGNKKIVQLLIQSKANINIADNNRWTPLHSACHKGHKEIVQKLIESEARVNKVSNNGSTPLHLAAQKGHEKIVELLIKSKVNFDIQDNSGRTPLYLASKNGHEKVVRLLLKKKANFRIVDQDGWTPVHSAAYNGHDKVVEVLLNFETNTDLTTTDFKSTPLHLATQNGHKKVVQLLIKHNARIDVCNKKGSTPLYLACKNGHDKLVQLFLKQKADYNVVDEDKWTPLHTASYNGHKKIVQILINFNVTIDVVTNLGSTPLYLAAQNDHENIVELLIKHNANISAKDKDDWTPLHIASKNGQVNIINLLIEHGAQLEAKDKDGWSPLYVACKYGHKNVVKLLIEHNADINTKDKDGWSLLHTASYNEHKNIAQLLTTLGNQVNVVTNRKATPLHLAAQKGHESVAEFLIEHNANLNAQDNFGRVPLYLAAKNGHENIVKLLTKHKAALDVRDNDGWTPLHTAAFNGHKKIVLLLAGFPESVNVTTKLGTTPLHLAAQKGHTNVVEVLIQQDANINAQDKNGISPLYLASKNGHKNVVKLLMQYNADHAAADKDGWSSLYVACKNGHQKVVKLLIENNANVDVRDNDGWTLLHTASYNEHKDILQLLITLTDSINVATKLGTMPLHLAAQRGHENIVRLLTEHGANLDAKDKYGRIPLYLASKNGHEKVVKVLTERKVNIDVKDNDGWTSLHTAAYNGHKTVVQLLLTFTDNVDVTTNVGSTSLHLATQNGHENIAKLLLEQNANPDAKSNDECTPLYFACKKGYRKLVELFLKRSVNFEVTTKDGWTPLHSASFEGHDKIVQLLINFGASIGVVTNLGSTPLHFAAQQGHQATVQLLSQNNAGLEVRDENGLTPLHLASQNGYTEIVEFLVRSKVSTGVINNLMSTPLHLASQNGHEEVVQLFIKYESDLERVDANGLTPLHLASHNGHEDVVCLLIQSKANLDAATNLGSTPLHLASENGHEKIVEMLIQCKINFEVPDKNGLTPLHLASQNGHKTVVQTLIKYKANCEVTDKNGLTPLHLASQNGHDEIVQKLIQNKVNLEATDKNALRPLHLASQNGHEEVVQLLIQSKANTDVVTNFGSTPLHLASENGHEDIAQLFILCKANIEASDKNGLRPLHLASLNGHKKIVQMLIKGKAHVEVADNNGFTPLHLASQNGHEEVVLMLVQSKASLNVVTNYGSTPLHLASKKGHKEVVQHLIECGAGFKFLDKNGLTPLCLADKNGQEEIAQMLRKRTETMANVNIADQSF
jgi:ankyrin repeat protein